MTETVHELQIMCDICTDKATVKTTNLSTVTLPNGWTPAIVNLTSTSQPVVRCKKCILEKK